MSERTFIAQNPEYFDPYAAHFGVSVDNYLSSVPVIGMEAVEIAQSGLVIVGPKVSSYGSRRHELRPKKLFAGAYKHATAGSESENTDISHSVIETIIPEVVDDFSKKRNIPPLAVIRVGAQLLEFTVRVGAGLGTGLDVYANRTRTHKGSLDSKLEFAISPINTVNMERTKYKLMGRVKNKLRRG